MKANGTAATSFDSLKHGIRIKPFPNHTHSCSKYAAEALDAMIHTVAKENPNDGAKLYRSIMMSSYFPR